MGPEVLEGPGKGLAMKGIAPGNLFVPGRKRKMLCYYEIAPFFLEFGKTQHKKRGIFQTLSEGKTRNLHSVRGGGSIETK